MIILPRLSMDVLKKRYLEHIDNLIADTKGRPDAFVSITMRSSDLEVLRWLISSFQVARGCTEVQADIFNLYEGESLDILHEMKQDANHNLLDCLEKENYIRTFEGASKDKRTKHVFQELCVVSYPLPGDIQKGE